MPGSTTTAVRSTPAPPARGSRLRASMASTTATGSRGGLAPRLAPSRRGRRAAIRRAGGDAIRISPAPARATSAPGRGRPVRPVTSLMTRAPASSAARAGTTRLVSAETGTSSLAVRSRDRRPSRSASSSAGDGGGQVGSGGHARRCRDQAPAAAMASRGAQEGLVAGRPPTGVEGLGAHVDGPHDDDGAAVADAHTAQGPGGSRLRSPWSEPHSSSTRTAGTRTGATCEPGRGGSPPV